jgi:hypothetical protein
MYHPNPYGLEVEDRGAAWGFCAPGRLPLPSRHDAYDPAAMRNLSRTGAAAVLRAHPGCGRLPLAFRGNRAVAGHGGAVFQGGCDGAAARGACFFAGLGPLSPSLLIEYEGNSAGGAGGAVYTACDRVGEPCRALMAMDLGLPLARPQRKLRFAGNRAAAWGDDVATAPASAELVRGGAAFVPGAEPLDAVLRLRDALGQPVRGAPAFPNPYVLTATSCSATSAGVGLDGRTGEAVCEEAERLGDNTYLPCAQDGLCAVVAPPDSLCPLNATAVRRTFGLPPSAGSDGGAATATGTVRLTVTSACSDCGTGHRTAVRRYTALSGATYDVRTCAVCGEGTTIADPTNPAFDCVPCPAGAACPNGAPPIFAPAVVSAGLRLAGGGVAAAAAGGTGRSSPGPLRSALAALLGVDPAQVLVSESSTRRSSEPAVSTIALEITADSSAAAALLPALASGALLANLTARLAAAGIDVRAVSISGAALAGPGGSTSNDTATMALVGVWEEAGGRYLLRRCPAGSLLVNASLEAQQCVACEQGSYTIADSDGCSGAGGVCQHRKCTACPLGAECSLGRLRGRVDGSVWHQSGQFMRLEKCPSGYILVR